MSGLAPTLEAFFTERLIGQRHVSPNTVAAYRDGWRLLLRFAHGRIGKEPAQLDIADLDAPLIAEFLDHLERGRRNSVRTRNARLCAIRSFFRYAALRHPSTPPSSPGCWTSRPNAASAKTSTTSTKARSTPCSPPPTAAHGAVGATTFC